MPGPASEHGSRNSTDSFHTPESDASLASALLDPDRRTYLAEEPANGGLVNEFGFAQRMTIYSVSTQNGQDVQRWDWVKKNKANFINAATNFTPQVIKTFAPLASDKTVQAGLTTAASVLGYGKTLYDVTELGREWKILNTSQRLTKAITIATTALGRGTSTASAWLDAEATEAIAKGIVDKIGSFLELAGVTAGTVNDFSNKSIQGDAEALFSQDNTHIQNIELEQVPDESSAHSSGSSTRQNTLHSLDHPIGTQPAHDPSVENLANSMPDLASVSGWQDQAATKAAPGRPSDRPPLRKRNTFANAAAARTATGLTPLSRADSEQATSSDTPKYKKGGSNSKPPAR